MSASCPRRVAACEVKAGGEVSLPAGEGGCETTASDLRPENNILANWQIEINFCLCSRFRSFKSLKPWIL